MDRARVVGVLAAAEAGVDDRVARAAAGRWRRMAARSRRWWNGAALVVVEVALDDDRRPVLGRSAENVKPLCAEVRSSGSRSTSAGVTITWTSPSGSRPCRPRRNSRHVPCAQRQRARHRVIAAGASVRGSGRPSRAQRARRAPRPRRACAARGARRRAGACPPARARRAPPSGGATTARGVRSTSAASPCARARQRELASRCPPLIPPPSRSGRARAGGGRRRAPRRAPTAALVVVGADLVVGRRPGRAELVERDPRAEAPAALGRERDAPHDRVRAARRLQLGLLRARPAERAGPQLQPSPAAHDVDRRPGAAQLQVDAVGVRRHGAQQRVRAGRQLDGADRPVDHEARRGGAGCRRRSASRRAPRRRPRRRPRRARGSSRASKPDQSRSVSACPLRAVASGRRIASVASRSGAR